MTSGRKTDVTGELGANIGELVRRELLIAVRELRAKGAQGKLGVVLLGAAGVCALYAGGFALRGLVLVLEKVLPGWAATLCVAGVLSLAAALAGVLGRQRLRAALPLLPERASADASEAASEAAQAAKEAVRTTTDLI